MAKLLLEMQPLELNFTFQDYISKEIFCAPNKGIIKPKVTYDFTVIMQAQKEAPPNLLCKDKFMIQCTVVPFGTTDKDIKSDMFAKDKETGKYVEEKKLRVVLISPPKSPVLLPRNEELKQDSSNETTLQKDRALSGLENVPPCGNLADDVKVIETAKDTYKLRAVKDVLTRPAEDVEELQPAKDSMELKLAKDYEELKLKLNSMESQLRRGGVEEKNNARKIQAGFLLLYVCMFACLRLSVWCWDTLAVHRIEDFGSTVDF
ncbi:hypothetical protein Dsin_029378 [Dipteronia sinensis]|uniref:MSP domain-containing protein n=1 Tax=Dipteronia sinensis TaxID=43782 RepID=A0AAD9ZTL6_9ROSI|nr:hypothetical protein Dsin_029378 [Dipteronia sinensis]